MLDIEEKLTKEPSYKDTLLKSLHLQLQQVKDAMNQGVSPEDYSNYNKYCLALESSLTILNKYEEA